MGRQEAAGKQIREIFESFHCRSKCYQEVVPELVRRIAMFMQGMHLVSAEDRGVRDVRQFLA